MIKNNCPDYQHKDGAPVPETAASCRGCAHSADPELSDSGCTLSRCADGNNLTAAEKRKVDSLLAKVNENRQHCRPAGAEYR